MTLTAGSVLADFSYQEKSTVTGGAMAAMLKVAGVFSKAAREPIQTNVSVKGDRMVSRGNNHATIIDINNQTITSIEFQKKTYSVMTFDEMKQMLEQAQQKMRNSKKDGDAQMTFKVSAKATGNVKTVNGFDTKEMVLTMEMQGTDEKSGQKGGMNIVTDMWIAPTISGYSEIREFHKHMAEKLNWSPNGSMFAANPQVAQGMAEVYKEVSKLDGMPVEQIVVMGVSGDQAATQSQAKPKQQEANEKPTSLGGLLAGRLAKKKDKDQAQQQDAHPGSLLEMTTEMTGFSSKPVDDAEFTVPAGFKKVESAKH
jgi:hypothetical protein